VLEKNDVEVKELRPARKNPFTDRDVRQLLGQVSSVIISKGKKSLELSAGEVKPRDLKGPTGNYRAPMVRKGKTLLVGFSLEALKQLIQAAR
jgi:hypothetical protein